MSRDGQKFGKLTVLNDTGAEQLHCQCDCGREGNYPRAITKPSYRGPKACPWCLGTPCEDCGEIIPRRGGMPAKTCSEKCRKNRANRLEKERYERIKDTDEFKQKRADYLARLAEAMESDPEFAESLRESHRKAVRAWRERQMSDPALKEKFLSLCREREAKRLERIKSDPQKYEQHLQKQREWYHSLTDKEYQRFFVEPREKRKKEKIHNEKKSDK